MTLQRIFQDWEIPHTEEDTNTHIPEDSTQGDTLRTPENIATHPETQQQDALRRTRTPPIQLPQPTLTQKIPLMMIPTLTHSELHHLQTQLGLPRH